ncbi:hypothetical protein GXW74_23450 [Roseomonas eburnea]|uniref:Membrane protein 6-pyruvoyl-tetrahydropterin synthase-related domain-containing protein n=1 Tax=Neoroseomonas eburnea TaxID=1346889 RepID=A0A9X9XIC6_9PROT|nr:hypothetical protein [Neoroseomonas eburnea]MBR0683462.1 hypothetical protein [Neoroseomonas eburnea]
MTGALRYVAATVGRPWAAVALLVLAGLAVTGPSLVLGTPPTDSATFNRTWTEQFSRLFAAGLLWPRWLPDSFDGLGSPAFFFYAPAPFWVAAVLDLLTLGLLPNAVLLGLLGAVLAIASGLAMHAWVARAASPWRATLAGLLYIAAPFHLFDHYSRGALGELAAYAVLPLVAAGAEDALRGRRGGVLRLGAALAALLLSHLPVSLVVAVLVLPCQGLGFLFACRPRLAAAGMAALRVSGSVLLGLALAASYVLPALLLQGHVSMHDMNEGYYDPRRWLLIAPGGWPNRMMLVVVGSLALAYAIAAAGMLALLRGARDAAAPRQWAAIALVLLAVMAGALPWLWEPWSPLARLQFPWRLLVPVEFALVTAVALGLPAGFDRRTLGGMVAVVLAMAPAVVVGGGLIATRYEVAKLPRRQTTEAAAVSQRFDAFEYLPPGRATRLGANQGLRGETYESLVAPYRDRAPAWSEPPGTATVTLSPDNRGAGSVAVRASTGTRIILRRFYYPLWRLEDAAGAPGPVIAPHGPDGLAAFEVPAGETALRLVWSPPPVMAAGAAVSLLGFLVLLGLLVRLRRAA